MPKPQPRHGRRTRWRHKTSPLGQVSAAFRTYFLGSSHLLRTFQVLLLPSRFCVFVCWRMLFHSHFLLIFQRSLPSPCFPICLLNPDVLDFFSMWFSYVAGIFFVFPKLVLQVFIDYERGSGSVMNSEAPFLVFLIIPEHCISHLLVFRYPMQISFISIPKPVLVCQSCIYCLLPLSFR